MNGVPSVSVLDGWWDEGYNGDNGWAIGAREQLSDEGAQDEADAEALYRLLEDEIVPRFFERDDEDLPVDWLATMRAAISASIWQFSTRADADRVRRGACTARRCDRPPSPAVPA